MVNNPNYYGQSTTGTTPTQIQDGNDFPHTGLIKTLAHGILGNYVISGFNITPTGNNTGTVSDGVISREGKIETISLSPNTFTIAGNSGGTTYSLLVIPANSNTTLAVRAGGIDAVADIDSGDTVIAVLGNVNAGASAFLIQYLTYSPSSRSLSIAYDNSGTYTEAGKLTGDTNGITMTGLYKLDTLPTATPATDDKIILQDTDGSDVIKTATAQQIADLSAYTDFDTDFAGKTTSDLTEGTNLYHTTTRVIDAVEAESAIDLTGSLSVAGNVVFNDAGASVDFRVESDNNVNMLVVDGSQDGVGINVASPDAELHVDGVSKTKGLVVNVVEQTASPPPFNTYDITDEDYIILASLDPIGNNLTLNLPSASSARTGQIYRLILPVTGTGSLTIDVQSGDQLLDNTRTPLTTAYEILSQTTPTGAAGDIWEVICLSGTEWMAYKL